MTLKDIVAAKSRFTEAHSFELPCLTQSLCPDCQVVVDAELYEDEGQVFMKKTCPEHGAFNELISADATFFKLLRRRSYETSRRPTHSTYPSQAGCPYDCGLCEQHLSTPVMLNIDLTNRCNLNCPICFANSNAAGRVYEITLEQLDQMLDDAMQLRPEPPWCLQLVGGEPTVHPDFLEALRRVKARGIYQVQVATNGVKFAQSAEFAQAAGEAGMDEVYLQFDGLDDAMYQKLRGRPLLEIKLRAIENLKNANVRVALVPTLVKGFNDHQVGAITEFAIDHIDAISTISWQPVAITGRINEEQRRQMRYTTADLARDLEQQLGFIDRYRDWYPFSIIDPFIRLREATEKKARLHCSVHPHCGCATYLVVDKQRHTAVPLPAFIDIEPAMDALNKYADQIRKHGWLKKISLVQAMRELKKHFRPEQVPEGWQFDDLLVFINELLYPPEELLKNKALYMEGIKSRRFIMLLMASMHFQDRYNYELDRSRRCVVFYAAPNRRFYPFCTWNSGPCHRYSVEQQFARPLT